MALVDEDEGVFRQVFHQRRGRLTRFPAGEMAGVVLDPRTVPHLLHHFDIEVGPLLQPLRLQELVFRLQFAEPLPQFLPDIDDCPFQIVLRRHVMAARDRSRSGGAARSSSPAGDRRRRSPRPYRRRAPPGSPAPLHREERSPRRRPGPGRSPDGNRCRSAHTGFRPGGRGSSSRGISIPSSSRRSIPW